MAKTAKKSAPKKATSVKTTSVKTADPFNLEHVSTEDSVLKRKKVKQLVASAPKYVFQVGKTLTCRVLSKIVPTEGKYMDQLIGWNVMDLSTNKQVMIGNTHQIEQAFTMPLEDGSYVSDGKQVVDITWLGKSEIGNGKTFNNYEIDLVEIED